MYKNTVQIFLAAVTEWRVEYEQICRHKNSSQRPDGITDITHVPSPPLSCDQRGSACRVHCDFPGCLTCCDWPSRQPARLLHYPKYQIAASVISTATTESEAAPGPPRVSGATCESPACGQSRGNIPVSPVQPKKGASSLSDSPFSLFFNLSWWSVFPFSDSVHLFLFSLLYFVLELL